MSLPRGLEDKIDQYVADALGATGTRAARASKPPPIQAAPIVDDVDIDVSDMDVAAEDDILPVEIDDRTDPGSPNIFSFDEGTAWLAPAFSPPHDQIPTLSRIRTARGSCPPPPEIDDDEVTNVVGIPPSPKP
ncbi:MAG TPA: hypothetical protein VMZ53_26420 [Kofleriaceae bacterium]|nr:hypothetical protein [Kofleriaceae bacterium]